MNNRYKSTPRNKMVADFCKDLGLIEKYGSGIHRVITLFKEARLPLPRFEQISGGLNVTVYSKAFEGVASDKVIDKVIDDLSENQLKIISMMLRKPYISTSEIANAIGISQRKIFDNIRVLKLKGQIAREGITFKNE